MEMFSAKGPVVVSRQRGVALWWHHRITWAGGRGVGGRGPVCVLSWPEKVKRSHSCLFPGLCTTSEPVESSHTHTHTDTHTHRQKEDRVPSSTLFSMLGSCWFPLGLSSTSCVLYCSRFWKWLGNYVGGQCFGEVHLWLFSEHLYSPGWGRYGHWILDLLIQLWSSASMIPVSSSTIWKLGDKPVICNLLFFFPLLFALVFYLLVSVPNLSTKGIS